MSFTYRYTHSVPTVFTGIQQFGHTWTANPGDEITLDYPVGHPHLELVRKPERPDTPDATADAEEAPEATQPEPTKPEAKLTAKDKRAEAS